MFAMDDSDDYYRKAVQAIKDNDPKVFSCSLKKSKGLITLSSSSSYSSETIATQIVKNIDSEVDFLNFIEAGTTLIDRKISHNALFQIISKIREIGGTKGHLIDALAGHVNQGGKFDFNKICKSDIRDFLSLLSNRDNSGKNRFYNHENMMFDVIARNNPEPKKVIEYIFDILESNSTSRQEISSLSVLLAAMKTNHCDIYNKILIDRDGSRSILEYYLINCISNDDNINNINNINAFNDVIKNSLNSSLSDKCKKNIRTMMNKFDSPLLACPDWVMNIVTPLDEINNIDYRVYFMLEIENMLSDTSYTSSDKKIIRDSFSYFKNENYQNIISDFLELLNVNHLNIVANSTFLDANNGFDSFLESVSNIFPNEYKQFLTKSLEEASNKDCCLFLEENGRLKKSDTDESFVNLAGAILISGDKEFTQKVIASVGGLDASIKIVFDKETFGHSFRDALTSSLDNNNYPKTQVMAMSILSQELCMNNESVKKPANPLPLRF